MVTIKPFKGWRPKAILVDNVAAPPYDVLSSTEARAMAKGNDVSFLKITKPEIDFEEGVDPYSTEVYQRGRKNWEDFIASGVFIQDEKPCLYFYRQQIGEHSQTGIVAASSIDDYFNDTIKKHEFTRPKKENDRIAHMKTLGVHPGPVFLTYKNHETLNTIIKKYTATVLPTYDFTAEDKVSHTLWMVDDDEMIKTIVDCFKKDIAATYIADGHHRAAASSKVGKQLRKDEHDKQADYNFFLSVLFPDNELKIIDYNRLIQDLNGLQETDFLLALEENFEVEKVGATIFKPSKPLEFGMYLNNNWYCLKAKSHTYVVDDPIKCLDVTVLSDYLIAPILDIKDQRTDERIDFVGGIRGLGELQKRVDSGEMKLAFALYPVSIQQLIDIADAGMVMPPKSTWFEPKLRSGLLVHSFK